MTYREELYQHVEAFVAIEREEMTGADTVDSVLSRLRTRGATAIEAMKVVDVLFSLTYPEAKIALTRCPAWSDITTRAEALHEDVEEAVRQLPSK